MFDTFDLVVPKLVSFTGLSVKQPENALGFDKARIVHFGEVRLGKLLPARVAFSNVKAWTGSDDRADWDVLLLSDSANTAAAADGTWSQFLAALLELLEHHPTFRLTCESDCEQHPLNQLYLTPPDLVTLLFSYRMTGHVPIAFLSERLAES